MNLKDEYIHGADQKGVVKRLYFAASAETNPTIKAGDLVYQLADKNETKVPLSLPSISLFSGTITDAQLPYRLLEYHSTNTALDNTVCGWYYASSGGPFEKWHTANKDFMIIAQGYSAIWGSLIATDFRSNQLAVRNKESGTWSDWAVMYSTANKPGWDDIQNKPSAFTPSSHSHSEYVTLTTALTITGYKVFLGSTVHTANDTVRMAIKLNLNTYSDTGKNVAAIGFANESLGWYKGFIGYERTGPYDTGKFVIGLNTTANGTSATYADIKYIFNNNGTLTAGGFLKSGSSDDYALLGGGGHIAITKTINSSSTDSLLPTALSVYTAINAGFAANDAMIYKGTYTATTTAATVDTTKFSNKPGETSLGWTWVVSGNGFFADIAVESGDMIIATVENPGTTKTNYNIILTNLNLALTKLHVTNTDNDTSYKRWVQYDTTANKLYVDTLSDATTLGGSTLAGLFTTLENSNNDISITIGGTNKKLTVGYATKAGEAASVSKSLIIKWGNGNTEGTNLFTYNGSGAKTIALSANALGVSETTHTHNVKINNAEYTIAASGGIAVDLGNYLPITGGLMEGPLTWKDSAALPQDTAGDYFLTITAFASGGTTKWISKADMVKALNLFTDFSNSSQTTSITIGGITKTLKIDADTVDGLHSGAFVRAYADSAFYDKGNYTSMSTVTGITTDWWHVLSMAWNNEFRWNSHLALPTLDRKGVYYRSGLDDNTGWGDWVLLLDASNSSVSGNTITINGVSTTWSKDGGNADTVDSLHARAFLRNYYNNTDVTTTETVAIDHYLFTVGDTGSWCTTSTKPTGMDNAFGILHVHLHAGNYAMQLGFGGTTNHLYFRNAYNSATFGNWTTVLDTSNLSYKTSGNNLAVQLDTSGNLYVTQTDNNTVTNLLLDSSSGKGTVLTTSAQNGDIKVQLTFDKDTQALVTAKAIDAHINTIISGLYWANIKTSTSSSTDTTPRFGSVGINTAIDTNYKLKVDGNSHLGTTATAANFISDVATGTLPYACTSTTVNTNLNADLLDGKHASDFEVKLPILEIKNTLKATTDWQTVSKISGYDSGTYIILVKCENIIGSGVTTIYKGDEKFNDEIPLHVSGDSNAWRPYLRISGENLQISVNVANATDKEYVITLKKVI